MHGALYARVRQNKKNLDAACCLMYAAIGGSVVVVEELRLAKFSITTLIYFSWYEQIKK